MRTSSAPEPETAKFGIEAAGWASQAAFSTSADSDPSTGPLQAGGAAFSSPNLTAYGSAYAVAARALARLNARTVKQEELQNLLSERKALLDKKFDGTITRKDENRLEYVRWSLGRVQDAKSGNSLDALESIVGAYEQFMSGMRKFEGELSDAIKGHKEDRRTRNQAVTRRGR